MEAKDKAKELVELFWDRIKGDTMYAFHVHQKNHTISFIQAKACAIICVVTIISSLSNLNHEWEKETYWHPIDYWKNVIQEINKL